MQLSLTFKQQLSVYSIHLPLTLMLLNTWVLIRVTGKDVISYLHNQFTSNIKSMNKYQYSFSAYCNPNGKMISNMYVFIINNQEIAFLIPLNISNKQIAIMKKYAIFYNVSIIPDYNVTLIGVAGKDSTKYLKSFFINLPNQSNTIIQNNEIIILYFNLPITRYLLIIINQYLLHDLVQQATIFNGQYNNHHQQWISLDIEAGYPRIDYETSNLFLPQSINLDILGGISFNKGCYLGQEVITKVQYRKLNKYSLYRLIGYISHYNKIQLPIPGNTIEIEITKKTWKKIGTVLQSCVMKNREIWIQAILHKPTLTHNRYRIKNITPEIIFTYIE